MKIKGEKSKLFPKVKEWIKKNGKEALGGLVYEIGESTPIPIVNGIIKSFGDKLKGDGSSKLDQAEFEALAKEDLEGFKLILADIADARDMYKSTGHEMADEVAKRVIKWNLWVVILAIVIEIIFVIFVDDKVLIAIISGAVGGFTTALLQERQQVISFFFGSSQGSKDKTKLLKK